MSVYILISKFILSSFKSF